MMMTLPRAEFCNRVFYGTVEVATFLLVAMVVTWLAQSRQVVIEQLDPPKVIAVTEDYLDVEWHNIRHLDCPTEGTPAFFTPYATAELPGRPVAASLQEQRFVRRYFFPEHLLKLHHAHTHQADPDQVNVAELRITITARCNPLWSTQQVIRVPFVMPRLDPDQP